MLENSLVAVQRRKLEAEFFPTGVDAEQIKMLTRVEEMLGQAFQAGYKSAIMYDGGEWSNNAALGYVIAAAQTSGYKEVLIKQLIREVKTEFDWKTIDEAKRLCENSPY